jgi:uncharacterized repeat protein (TIGR01451 family)
MTTLLPFLNRYFLNPLQLFFKAPQWIKGNSKSCCSKISKVFLMLLFLISATLNPISLNAQSVNEAEWTGQGYSLKKVVSNTSIQSGVNFSYTILFTAPAGATTVNIQDLIPTNLVVVNVPTPSLVNGVAPVVTIVGAVGSQVVTYNLSSLPPGSPSSGSFTIVVKFPEGITCNGASARNRIGIRINQEWFYTPYVSTTALAVNPWKISKSILQGPVVNPNGGNCGYLMDINTTVTYRLAVLKENGYWGNVIGQHNMTVAQVTDVLPTGAVFVSSTPGAVNWNSGTGTITWNPNSGILDAANPWAYYWVDITVSYPAAFFPYGSFVYNQATLSGSVCQGPALHQSNQTCIEIEEVDPNPNAFFQKYVNVTNRVPGCQGFYTIIFCNNGNVPLSNFTINDVIPAGISVDKVQLYGAGANTPVHITANSGGNTIANNLISNWFDSGTLGYPVNNLQVEMAGVLPVGQCLYIYIYFDILANPIGTMITNCATFNGMQNNLTLPQTCATFTVDAGQPLPCLHKEICSPQTDYEPGDIIRFRIRVQNIGSATLTGAAIQDVLHSNFSYLGNESYYVSNSYNPPCSPNGGIPSGTTAWAGVASTHSGNNLSWNLPSIASDCQSFYVAYCGYYGTWGIPYYYIEFDVQVDGAALPGVTLNNYIISGGNLQSTVTSNTVNVLVVASFGQELEKQVSGDNGQTFASTTTIAPGGNAKFRLNYKNTSNVPVLNINLFDLLAFDDGPSNDWLIMNRLSPRGSQFDITYAGAAMTSLLPVGAPPVPIIHFSPGENICIPQLGVNLACTPPAWGPSPITENIRFNFGSYSLLPTVTLREDFNVVIPQTALSQQVVCNDFGAIATANFLLNGNPQAVQLTPIASAPICLTVGSTETCCDSLKIEKVSDADGNGCCLRLTSDCPIKSIDIQVINGTFSSATWNCGNIPTNIAGLTAFTFAPGSCIVDLLTCFSPDQPGAPIIVNYLVNFENGERCERVFDLICDVPQEKHCCDSVQVIRVSNPTNNDGCCAKLETTCEVDSIKVSVTNGTFNYASSTCGTLPSGISGASSFWFYPNCAIELTTCITPIVSGLVTITYDITFANGEKCVKVIEFDCKAPDPQTNCCDSIVIEQYSHPDLGECCTRLKSDCEIKLIDITLINGTFSYASWACGTIPSNIAGQTSHSFVPGNNCPVDLLTCFEAIQDGYVGVSYLITFANGDTCRKDIRIDCKVPEKHCCDSVQVIRVSNPTNNDGCCAKLETTCEVDSIKVSVTNGTFNYASSTCGTLPSGISGASSFWFYPNCAIELTTCITPIVSGLVTITYDITFANGEKCVKVIEFDCKAPDPQTNCCDSIVIEQYSHPDLGECCTRLKSDCEINSDRRITLINGTFSYASWACGTIPSNIAGQTSHSFVPR